MKVADKDAVSGPAVCARNMSFPVLPEFSHTNTSSLTLVGHIRGEGYLLLRRRPVCDNGWS